jgi:hypothetical protein
LYPNSLEIVAITPGRLPDEEEDCVSAEVVFQVACVEVFIIEPNPKIYSYDDGDASSAATD